MNARRLPSLKATEVIRALEKAGFVVARSKGAESDAKRTVNPREAGQQLDEAGQLAEAGR